MAEIIIDKKKHILIADKDYKALKKGNAKNKVRKLLSVEDARTYSKKLIRKWAAGK